MVKSLIGTSVALLVASAIAYGAGRIDGGEAAPIRIALADSAVG